MRWILGSIAFALTAVLATAWNPPSPPPLLDEDTLPREVTPPDEAPRTIEELRRRMEAVIQREGVPGVAIALISREGPIWIDGIGVRDRQTREPVTATTVFRVASITKSFVGLGVMKLVEQGRLELDKPLSQLMPEVAIENAWPDSPVTLGQVLEHTAGLDDMRPSETFVDDDAMPAADALALNPRSRVIRWRPGTRLSYSNVGYGIAGRAIELATHEPFDVWLRREVLQPLGMRDADFRRTERLAARLAIGYSDPDTPAPFTPIAHRAAGSLLASATDLGKLVQFWLRRGDGTPIVSRAGLDRIERQGTMPYPRMDLEYGLGNYGDVAHPVFSRGHDGGLPGFVSTLRYFPELGVGYVLLLNATHSARAHRELRGLAFAYLTRDLVLPVAPAVAAQRALPSAEAYRFASPRHALLGFLERSLLAWRTTPTLQGVYVEPLIGWPHELERTQDGGYRIRGESGTSVRFLHDRDGTPIMIHHFMYAEATPWWLARVRLAALTLAFWLVLLAPLWGALTYAVNRARSRRVIAWDLVLGPAIAGLCLHALPRLFLEAARAQVLGEVHPWTIAVCATTIVFGLASLASVIAAIRWQRRADRPALWRRFVPSAMALSAGGLALWFAANGIIGLRTWAW